MLAIPPGVPVEAMEGESAMVVDADGIPRYEYGWDVGDPLAGSACSSCNPCGVGCSPCGPWGRHWIRVQYLPWITKGMSIPPLVTTSPGSTPVQDAGVLGLDSTDVILGNGDILDDVRHGARLQIGTWLDTCQWWGLELDLAGLDQKSDGYSRSSTGNPILARPFYNCAD